MPNLNNWLSTIGGPFSITEADRAVAAYNRINDNPAKVFSLVLVRNGSAQGAQTVRVEEIGMSREASDTGGGGVAEVNEITAVVFGVRNHPTVTDTDIAAGDRFGISGIEYEVRDVILHAGEVQAHAFRVI